jgi:hypothetical protein
MSSLEELNTNPISAIVKSFTKRHSRTHMPMVTGKDLSSETLTGALTESTVTVMTLTCVFQIVSIVAPNTGYYTQLVEISSTWLRMKAKTASTTTMVLPGYTIATLVTTKSSLRNGSMLMS